MIRIEREESPFAPIPPSVTPFALSIGRHDEVLHDLFVEVARRYPDNIAIRLADVDPGGSRKAFLTYRDLDERADRFAQYLIRRNVSLGDRVVICLPRGLEQYWCLLGVLKVGAAYVPVDWSSPPVRLGHIAVDSGACVIVTNGSGPIAALDAGIAVIDLDVEMGAIDAMASVRPRTGAASVSPDDLAYIIYTSGSTGSPKGAMIRHRNACHFVRAESAVLGLLPSDRAYGGFSLAFDMSVETMWTGWFAGAEVVCPSEALAMAGPDVAAVIADLGVTVWHVVPSLLGVVERDVACLRLINLGGEACPPALVKRWWTPARRLVNTYGPTEATVTATWAELLPDRPVTIGRPLPGYKVWIVGPSMMPVRHGEDGELVIGGPGVGAGYVNRPDLNAANFVTLEFFGADGTQEFVYRTGDHCRLDGNQEIEYLGRIDSQVKIRGYRVELSEIEAMLLEDECVAQAAVSLYPDEHDEDVLVAWVAPRMGSGVNVNRLKETLRARLPAYMQPQFFEVKHALPTLVSGKVDRKALGRPRDLKRAERLLEAPDGVLEEKLQAIWAAVFAPQQVCVLDNFFEDLGGHSLKAARMVSLARSDPALAKISIQDVYQAQTIRLLASRLQAAPGPEATAPAGAFQEIDRGRWALCMAAQGVSIVILFAYIGLQWIVPYLAYFWTAPARGPLAGLEAAAATFVVIPPLMLALSIPLKWLIIGRVKAGDYPLWGGYFFRWWLVRRILAATPIQYIAATPLINVYFRLLGARVGRNVFMGVDYIDAPDLVTIGDDVIISGGAVLSTVCVERGLLQIGSIELGRGVFIGNMAVVERDTAIGERAALDDLSALQSGWSIPAGERWIGAPARPNGGYDGGPAAPPRSAAGRAAVTLALLAIAIVLPLAEVLPITPGLVALIELSGRTQGWVYYAAAPLLALSYVLSMCALTVAVKWGLMGRIKPGRYSIWSGFYVRYWLAEHLNSTALTLLHPIFATLYVRPWYKALGAKVGARSEISSASAVSHDLIEFGEESFIADGVSFGAARMEPGSLRLAPTRVGRRSFVGNSALLPAGSYVADETLIGVMSMPPARPEDYRERGATWFGSPALKLPNRQASAPFDDNVRFRPSKGLIATRLAIEYVRVTLSMTVFLMLFSVMLSALTAIMKLPHGLLWMLIAFPVIYLAFNMAAALFVIALKWVVIGKYKPHVAPLWSLFVWRSELVTSTYETLMSPMLLEPLHGTPYINVFLRLLGARIGKRVFTDTTDITEFDLVTVGDDVALNSECGLQTHLFEDRVMKLGTIEVGDRASVGTISIVLYDAVMEPGARLGELSVVMKGERLPADTSWEGSPAQARAA
jgi:non-ribosomal peptide synthetase-like protein